MKIVNLNSLPVTTTSHNKAGRKKVLVANGTIPNLTQFAQVSFSPGETALVHAHKDVYEVFLVENGEGTFIVNGKPELLGRGSCIVIEPGELHELTNTGGEDLVLTYFGIKHAR